MVRNIVLSVALAIGMLILLTPIILSIPASSVLVKLEDTTKSDLTIKATGHQWKWTYEYVESGIEFDSILIGSVDLLEGLPKQNSGKPSADHLLDVDNMLVIPSGRKVRFELTSSDVIHAWWVPAFGVKKDAIPGYINEIWFNVQESKEGIYRGQCAELCGKGHIYMPVVVKVVTGAEFDAWLAAGGRFAAPATPSVEGKLAS